jgi:IMP dehydrogenase
LVERKMDKSKIVAEGITFDDVLLVPAESDLVPSQAQTATKQRWHRKAELG